MSERSAFREDLLAGTVALVTGGSSGIGLEIARQLGLHGAKVAISGRREAVLHDACESLKGEGIAALAVQVGGGVPPCRIAPSTPPPTLMSA